MNLFSFLHLNISNWSGPLYQAQAQFNAFTQNVKTSAAQIATGFAGGSTAIGNTTSHLMQFRNTLAGASVAVGMLATGFTALAASMVKSFANQEQAFSGILKTVEATDEQFEQLRDNLTALSNRAPVKFEDLAKIGELAGQLGIRGVANLTKFIETMMQVAESTNLTTESAAMGFARIATVMQEPIANIDRMGAVVVDLGNKFEATESEILNFSIRIAATGKIAGLTVGQVLGIATAFASVGVQAEAGGTAINKMLMEMTTAVATNSDKLLIFAKLAGDILPEAFKKLFRTDPAEAFTKVIEGLRVAGDGAFAALEAITGIEQRFLRAMLSESQAGDKLRLIMIAQGVAWRENIAHIIEFEKKIGTLQAHYRILQNNIENFSASLGKTLAPVLRLFSQIGTAVIQGFQSLEEWQKTLVALTIAATAVTLAFTAFLTTLGFIAIAVKAIGISLTALAIIFGVTTGSLVLLGGAILVAIRYFGLFSESSNQLEARLRSQNTEIKKNEEQWKGWWLKYQDTMSGIAIKTHTTDEEISGFFSNFTSYFDSAEKKATQSSGFWTRFWEGFASAPSKAMEKFPFIMKFVEMLKFLKYFEDAGEASRLTAKRNAEAAANWTDEIVAANTALKQNNNNLASGVMTMEQYEREIRKIELAMQRQTDAAKISGAMLKVQRETEKELLKTEEIVFREREQAARDELDEKLKTIGATRSGLEQELTLTRDGTKALAEKIGVMKKGGGKEAEEELAKNQQIFKDRSKNIDEITKKIQDSNTERIMAEQDYSLEATKIWRDREELKLRDLFASAKVNEENDKRAIESARMLFDVKEDQSDRLKELYESDTETFIRETKKKGNYAAVQLEESLKAIGTSEGEILRRVSEELALIDVKILEFLRRGLRESRAEVSGLREAMGLEQWTLDYQKLTLAQAKFFTSYKDLLPGQRDYIDILAESRAEIEKNKLVTEQLTIANDAYIVGLGHLIGVGDVKLAQDIRRNEARLQSTLGTLTTINDEEQKSAILRSQIQEQQIIRDSRRWEGFGETVSGVFDFIGARTRRYVAEQDTVWQGLGKVIVDVFSGVQRTLSDVFFEFFTTGTLDLERAWKSMLGSMLRTLADFLASQAMRAFLSFVFGASEGGGLAGMAGAWGASLVGAAGSSGLLGSVGSALGLVVPNSLGAGAASGAGSPTFSFPGFTSGLNRSGIGGVTTPVSSGFNFNILSPSFTPTEFPSIGPDVGGFGGGGDFGDWGDWGGYWATGGRVPGSGR